MTIRGSQSALLVCTAMALVSGHSTGHAQDADAQNGPTVLERITIKGKRVKAGDAAADTPLASSTSAEEIRTKEISSLKDLGKTTEPGVDFVNSKPGKPGGLFIRGLGGARVTTLIDGIPVPFFENFARQGQATTTISNTNSSFDFSSLSSVDVVRGADSSRVGSGALGGALVLRTLEADDLISDGKDWGGVAKTTYDSEDRSFGGSVAVAKKIENTSVLFQGSYKRGNEVDNKGGADIYGTRRTAPNPADTYESNLMFKIRQDLEGGHRIGLTAERFSLRTRTDLKTLQGSSVSGSTYRIDDYNGYEDTERDRVSLDYQYEAPSKDSLIDAADLSLYWTRLDKVSGAGDRLTNNSLYIREDSMRDSRFGLVGGLESGFELGSIDHTVRFGGNAWISDFTDSVYINTGGSSAASQSDMPDVTGKSLGFYLEDELAFGSSGFKLTPGLRFDAYDYDPDGSVSTNSAYNTFGLPTGNSGSRFSPKLLATYDLTPEVQLFAQWAMAYRAPTVNELYLNFSNISTGYAVVGNSSLKPETSSGFEIGAKYDAGDFSGSLTLFHNKYKNFIEQTTTTTTLFPGFGGIGNGSLFTYQNRPNVEISGVEAKVRKDLANGFFTHASLAYAYGKDTDTNEFIRTVAPFKSVVGVGYAQETWGTEFTGVFSSHMRADISANTFDASGYGIFNLTGWWEPEQAKGLRIQAGVYNLFDRKYWNAVGVRDINPNSVSTVNQPIDFYSEPGRSFKISLTQKF
ncbi:TonB-dependent hemoglobin/transferrin/lactoferrin family receptor [Agrobacterium rosae]|uniref:TonB-dependent hemoglobin/transferrin/lactoferrin family receptor n=1 Tax=Agrobacterium rosae TaxID=1972867 RepID=A0AAE5S0Q5_9HYPH|nr:TonB-dependent hemoglobin/transferrin/lactoferrin family receptor [Agrobacterium rosae]KAA3513289.1 TonB-dependent hemoglobin/transferrin/lactoferrin family receptor [Agrobacterium rosae]KAA3521228.1 TonB-dependent hemoglobin/transferrin/lactoferrin family receptor [Agrobacterium rosae]MCM2432947.1 TonB-dependent hemoglobin/transferrin/lactoferrin family receptor [Agrobacterium rosae]MDX8327984.1 TonB-dependent hemoglobin/transferrin/lactoferrin family receptor [Agrobacterium rosae]MQB48095